MKPALAFTLSALGLGAAIGYFTWGAAALSAGFLECGGPASLASALPGCRWPPVAHFGVKAGATVFLLFLLLGIRAARKSRDRS